ncbi:lipase maturation factor 1 isoform X3 [Vulpes lagopus]|uniref:lipase maturation factor 1 isoform X3 n=2 Tax=Vulpes lagopus TaxID=494514 RepID=UPI001BC9781A|nr:lipase maturation factor 1 isoform X3 [Vulpes lagopus]
MHGPGLEGGWRRPCGSHSQGRQLCLHRQTDACPRIRRPASGGCSDPGHVAERTQEGTAAGQRRDRPLLRACGTPGGAPATPQPPASVAHRRVGPPLPESRVFWPTEQMQGWESQLLETGFLGIFLCPLWTLSRLPRGTPPSRIVLWGFRWLIFRIMLGAGLIKIRGDRCWRDLTCMDFHYETQPVPNPAAYFLHQSPWWVHRGETLGNHFVELVVPFFIFLGRRMCVLHGALQILFQVILIISGNLSFLNWLTMVPSVACFDDATLGFLFPSGPSGLKYRVLKMQEEAARGAPAPLRYGCVVRQAVHLALAVLVAWLSVPVVLNLLSPTQIMNTSFNPLRIVNTYGAFGSITKERTEVILQGTAAPNASSPDAVWEDYEFKYLRAQRVDHPPGRQAPGQRCLSSVPTGRQPFRGQGAPQVAAGRALQVQIQPPWRPTRRRRQVVAPEEDRPLLPPRQPPGPGGLLPLLGVAAPGRGCGLEPPRHRRIKPGLAASPPTASTRKSTDSFRANPEAHGLLRLHPSSTQSPPWLPCLTEHTPGSPCPPSGTCCADTHKPTPPQGPQHQHRPA